MWYSKMFDGIKAGQSRMEIAEQCGATVYIVSKYANVLKRTHDYRAAGISDEEYARWYETSLIGLQTVDGDPVIERTAPDEKNVESVLQRLRQGYEPEFELKKIKMSANPKNIDCFWCKRRGSFDRCPKHAYADNKAIGCKNFRAR